MPRHAIVRLFAALTIIFAASPSFAALSGSATLTTTSTSAPYDYTINLKNTGDVPIEGFWFAWTPPGEPAEYDFMTSQPTFDTTNSGPFYWYAYLSQGLRPSNPLSSGYGLEFYDYYNAYYGGSTIYGIAPGSTAQFNFSSNDSPAQLNSLVGAFPTTTSFIYSGYPESSTEQKIVVAVPEPAGLTLAGLAAIAGFIWWSRNRNRKIAA
ncbi:MAG TPA: PEP-CTERM sorting domain-containing protein [Pirellulales bacterium]|jgi:hypothetical protein